MPVYQTFGDLTSADLPVYYTNLYPNVQAAWDADGSEDFYVIVSEPFDATEPVATSAFRFCNRRTT